MTQDSSFLQTYRPAFPNKNIIVADGNSIPIAGQGDAKSTTSLSFENFLHAPKLSSSLISVHQLTKIFYCDVIFFLMTVCNGRRIEPAKEINGMYYLKNGTWCY